MTNEQEQAASEYRSLLAECAGLAFRAQHCDLNLMDDKQVRDILKRVKEITFRKDVRANLCKQISPAGSRSRPMTPTNNDRPEHLEAVWRILSKPIQGQCSDEEFAHVESDWQKASQIYALFDQPAPQATRTCLECEGEGWFSPTPVRSDGWRCVPCDGTGTVATGALIQPAPAVPKFKKYMCEDCACTEIERRVSDAPKLCLECEGLRRTTHVGGQGVLQTPAVPDDEALVLKVERILRKVNCGEFIGFDIEAKRAIATVRAATPPPSLNQQMEGAWKEMLGVWNDPETGYAELEPYLAHMNEVAYRMRQEPKAATPSREQEVESDSNRTISKLALLLKEALLESMGGEPDLFSPRPDGWESWWADVEVALASGGGDCAG